MLLLIKSEFEKPEVLMFILKVTLLNHMAATFQATGAARVVKVKSLHNYESDSNMIKCHLHKSNELPTSLKHKIS